MVGPIREWAIVALVSVGVFFLTVGTIGLLRLPNVYNRMHATSKPTTLGTAAIFLAGFVYFGPGNAGMPSLIGIVFLFLTVPTGAHMISRSAQKTGVPFLGSVTWPGRDGGDGRRGENPDAEGRDAEDRDGGDRDADGRDVDNPDAENRSAENRGVDDSDVDNPDDDRGEDDRDERGGA